jgi:hypothetical protein
LYLPISITKQISKSFIVYLNELAWQYPLALNAP